MFAIVEAVKAVAVFSQTTCTSTPQDGFQQLVLLATTVLEPKLPLSVAHVQVIGQKEDDIEPPASRPHAGLTKVGAATRLAFAKAVATLFVAPRYGEGLSSHSHRYDMSMFLTPRGRSMRYLDTLKKSTVGDLGGFVKPASEVKERIIDQARDLLVTGIIKSRSKAETPVDVELDAPITKRFKPAVDYTEDPHQVAFRAAGLMDSSSDEETDPADEPDLSPKEEAESILLKWQTTKVRGRHYWLCGVSRATLRAFFLKCFMCISRKQCRARFLKQAQACGRLVLAF